MAAVATLPPERRFVVIDASRMQAPGATGTDHRLPIAMDLQTFQCVEVLSQFRVVLCDAHGQPMILGKALQRSPWKLSAPCGAHPCLWRLVALQGWHRGLVCQTWR